MQGSEWTAAKIRLAADIKKVAQLWLIQPGVIIVVKVFIIAGYFKLPAALPYQFKFLAGIEFESERIVDIIAAIGAW